MREALEQLALLRFARLIVGQLGSISSLSLIPTIHSFSSLRVQRNTHGVLANPDLRQAMAPSKQKRTHTVFRASSAHRLASTRKPRFVGEKVKLGDVCDVLNGFAFKSRQYVDKGIRIIRIANVQKGYLEDSKPCFYPVKHTDSLKQYILEENDLLVSLTGNVGRVALLEKSFLPAALNQRVACLRIKDESRICKRYLYHALNSSLFENNCVESANGIAQKNMSTTWLKGYRIPAPSMVEQEIIIKQLDLIQRQISNIKRQLSEFDSLVKSRFVEMFGDPKFEPDKWAVKPLGDVCATRLGKMLDAKKQTGECPYPYLANANVQWFRFELSNLRHMDFPDEDRIEFALNNGDVLVTEGGEVGRCAIWRGELKDCYFQKAVHRVRCNTDCLLPEYFVWCFKMKSDLGLFEPYISRSTIAHLTGKKIKQVPIPLPPLALQQEFAAFVSQVDKSRFVRDHEINFRWERFTLSWSTIA